MADAVFGRRGGRSAFWCAWTPGGANIGYRFRLNSSIDHLHVTYRMLVSLPKGDVTSPYRDTLIERFRETFEDNGD